MNLKKLTKKKQLEKVALSVKNFDAINKNKKWIFENNERKIMQIFSFYFFVCMQNKQDFIRK